jgi:long-chain acyl-CoA synthetase
MVYGDKRPHLVALIVPDQEWLNGWAKQNGRRAELSEIHTDKDLRAALDEVVTRVNRHASNLEKIRRFIIPPEGFTVENHMLTPTLKIRRHKIKQAYQADLETLY